MPKRPEVVSAKPLGQEDEKHLVLKDRIWDKYDLNLISCSNNLQPRSKCLLFSVNTQVFLTVVGAFDFSLFLVPL